MYGYLLATDYACLGLASAVLLPCLIRFCRLTDLSLAIIGVIFKIFRLAMISYGQYSWLVYLSVVVGCPSALIISSSKSLISKLVGEDQKWFKTRDRNLDKILVRLETVSRPKHWDRDHVSAHQ